MRITLVPSPMCGVSVMAKDAKSATAPIVNEFDERAVWLRHAFIKLRPDFEHVGLPLPENVRFGFSTKGNGTQATGECWHSPASADGAYEVFIRADQEDPLTVLGILVRQLVHAALPAEESHGKRFKAATQKIGLVGKMRSAMPGHLLQARLKLLAEELGPLPHASLDLTWSPFERKKKQTNRYLRATCTQPVEEGSVTECGYSVRISSKWAKLGALCPLHGAITVEVPNDIDDDTPDVEAPPIEAAADAHSEHHEHTA